MQMLKFDYDIVLIFILMILIIRYSASRNFVGKRNMSFYLDIKSLH